MSFYPLADEDPVSLMLNMTKKVNKDHISMRINVTFTKEAYDQIKHLASVRNECMSALLRDWALQGLNGELNVKNISLISHIIREQIDSVLGPKMERQIALTAKTCIQASAAAYLTAEAISGFLPDELQQDFQETYIKARKKAVEYTRRKNETLDE